MNTPNIDSSGQFLNDLWRIESLDVKSTKFMRHLVLQESSDQDKNSNYLMKKIKNIKLTNHKKLGKKKLGL
jgi:hypothetical protein